MDRAYAGGILGPMGVVCMACARIENTKGLDGSAFGPACAGPALLRRAVYKCASSPTQIPVVVLKAVFEGRPTRNDRFHKRTNLR